MKNKILNIVFCLSLFILMKQIAFVLLNIYVIVNNYDGLFLLKMNGEKILFSIAIIIVIFWSTFNMLFSIEMKKKEGNLFWISVFILLSSWLIPVGIDMNFLANPKTMHYINKTYLACNLKETEKDITITMVLLYICVALCIFNSLIQKNKKKYNGKINFVELFRNSLIVACFFLLDISSGCMISAFVIGGAMGIVKMILEEPIIVGIIGTGIVIVLRICYLS